MPWPSVKQAAHPLVRSLILKSVVSAAEVIPPMPKQLPSITTVWMPMLSNDPTAAILGAHDPGRSVGLDRDEGAPLRVSEDDAPGAIESLGPAAVDDPAADANGAGLACAAGLAISATMTPKLPVTAPVTTPPTIAMMPPTKATCTLTFCLLYQSPSPMLSSMPAGREQTFVSYSGTDECRTTLHTTGLPPGWSGDLAEIT